MLQITAFGLKYLAKNGVFLNKMGEPSKAPENVKNLPRAKQFERPEESSRAKEQVVEQLGGLISTRINSYFSQPDDIISKKGTKKSKHNIENYLSKSEDGYLKEDRVKFMDVANQIAKVCGDSEVRPAGEHIFSSIKNIMDKIPDKGATAGDL